MGRPAKTLKPSKMYRQLRRRDKILVDGPVTISVESGRCGVTIQANPAVNIQIQKRKSRLTKPPLKD